MVETDVVREQPVLSRYDAEVTFLSTYLDEAGWPMMLVSAEEISRALNGFESWWNRFEIAVLCYGEHHLIAGEECSFMRDMLRAFEYEGGDRRKLFFAQNLTTERWPG